MLFKANLPCLDVYADGANTMPQSTIQEDAINPMILLYNTIAQASLLWVDIYFRRPFTMVWHLNTAYYRQKQAGYSAFIAPITTIQTSDKAAGGRQGRWANKWLRKDHLLGSDDPACPSVGSQIKNVAVTHLPKGSAGQ